MNTKYIEIIDGPYHGLKGPVTFQEGSYMRMTPVPGDPLVSLEVRESQTIEIDKKDVLTVF